MKRFAVCLRQVLATKTAYEALDAGSGGTWTAGGCWTLAHAVNGLVGGELVALVTGFPNEGPDGIVVQHVAVKVGTRYLDGDGLSTLDELRHRWHEELRVTLYKDRARTLRVVPFTPELQQMTLERGHAACHTGTVTAILPALMKCARRKR